MYEVVRIYGQTWNGKLAQHDALTTYWTQLCVVMCRFSFPLFYWQLNSHIFLFCVSLCSKNANVLLFITFKQFFSLKKGGEGGHVFLKSASEHYSAGHSRESLEKRESGTASIQNVTHAILSTVHWFWQMAITHSLTQKLERVDE